MITRSVALLLCAAVAALVVLFAARKAHHNPGAISAAATDQDGRAIVTASDPPRNGRADPSNQKLVGDLAKLIRAEFEAGQYGRCLQLASKIELDDLEAVWSWLDEVEEKLRSEGKNVGFATEMRVRVLSKASILGATDQAIRLVTTAFGPGYRRTSFLSIVFHASSLPVHTLIETAQQLEHEDERTAAFVGVGSKIASLDSLSDAGDLSALVSMPGGIDAIRKALSDYPVTGLDRSSARRTTRIQEALAAAQGLLSEPGVPTQLLSEVVAEIGRNLPFETWDILNAQSSPLLEDETVLGNLLRGMSRDDPIRAMDMIAANHDLPEQGIQVAMTSALQRDVTVANEWYENNAEKLPQSQRDYLSSAFAVEGATHQEVETAWNWVAQIEDPQIRRTAEGRVWQAELSQVQGEARKAPRATVEAIVSGESPHATYWIETAMNEWMAQDAASAQAWYEENRNSLTPEQNEPVALAYARRAISQGDLDTATEWALHVISQKHRAKIEAELAAAAETEAP